MKLEIWFDTWRQDMVDEAGRVTQENVLFVRATVHREASLYGNEGTWAYHCPVFEEEEQIVIDANELMAQRGIHDALTR